MSGIIHEPIYRLTVYAQDGSPLTPAVGSVHSDEFKVTTVSGSAGWIPYLNRVAVDYGNAAIPKPEYATGKAEVSITDFRTGTDNLERWVTAFTGDDSGLNRIVGRKVLIQESLDNGSTWNPYFFGRISDIRLDNPMTFGMTIVDDATKLRNQLFEVTPTDTGSIVINRFCIFPYGWEKDFRGNIPAQVPEQVLVAGSTAGHVRLVTPENAGDYSEEYIQLLRKKFQNTNYTDLKGNQLPYKNLPRAEIYNTSGTKLGEVAVTRVNPLQSRIVLWIYRLPSSDPQYFNTFGMSGEYEIRVFDNEDGYQPFYITAPHSLDMIPPVLDGHFSSGSYNIDVTYDTDNLNRLKDETSDSPPFIAKIKESWEAQEFIEKVVLQPNMLSYYLDSEESASAFKVFSMDFPTSSAGSTTISGSHLVNEPLEWSSQVPYTFEVVSYDDFVNLQFLPENLDRELDPEEPRNYRGSDDDLGSETGYDVGTTVRKTIENYITLEAGTDFLNPRKMKIDCNGLRNVWAKNFDNFDNELYQSGSWTLVSGKQVNSWVGDRYLDRFGTTLYKIELECRRTNDIEALNIGDWAVLDIDWLPDPKTRKRGGARLVQIVGKNPNGISTSLEFLDGGFTQSLSAPIVDTSLSGSNSVNIDITASSDAYHRIEYAFLPTAEAAPEITSSFWSYFTSSGIQSGSSKRVVADNFPTGVEVYVRSRAQRPLSGATQPISAWATASSAVEIAQISSPTGLTLTGATSYSVDVSWSNAGDYRTEVQSTANADGTMERYSIESVGTSEIKITRIDRAPQTSNDVQIRHLDDFGGVSEWVSASFSRGTDVNAAPSMSGIFVFDYTVWS